MCMQVNILTPPQELVDGKPPVVLQNSAGNLSHDRFCFDGAPEKRDLLKTRLSYTQKMMLISRIYTPPSMKNIRQRGFKPVKYESSEDDEDNDEIPLKKHHKLANLSHPIHEINPEWTMPSDSKWKLYNSASLSHPLLKIFLDLTSFNFTHRVLPALRTPLQPMAPLFELGPSAAATFMKDFCFFFVFGIDAQNGQTSDLAKRDMKYIEFVLQRLQVTYSQALIAGFYLLRNQATIVLAIQKIEDLIFGVEKKSSDFTPPSSPDLSVSWSPSKSLVKDVCSVPINAKEAIRKILESGWDGGKRRGQIIWTVAIMIATKYAIDNVYSNLEWAKAARLPLGFLNFMERLMLNLMNHDLHIDDDMLTRWLTYVFDPNRISSFYA